MATETTDFDEVGFRSARVPKTSERIARQIVNLIIDKGLRKGTVLPNEKQLVEAFNVGRTTIREALRLLETRGVLTIRSGPGGGPVVRLPQPDDLRESLTLILQFSGSSLQAVLEARTALEPMMARLACARITGSQLDDLSDSIEQIRQNPNDQSAFLEQNQRFHSIVAEATGNHVLLVFNDTLKTIADGAILGIKYTARRRLLVADAHEKVLSALRAKDCSAAESLMYEHVNEAGTYWKQKYPQLVNEAVRWTE